MARTLIIRKKTVKCFLAATALDHDVFFIAMLGSQALAALYYGAIVNQQYTNLSDRLLWRSRERSREKDTNGFQK